MQKPPVTPKKLTRTDGQTDGPTDRPTDIVGCRVACTRLKREKRKKENVGCDLHSRGDIKGWNIHHLL